MGVLNAARQTMIRMLGNTESAFESAREQFWVIDASVGVNLFLIPRKISIFMCIDLLYCFLNLGTADRH